MKDFPLRPIAHEHNGQVAVYVGGYYSLLDADKARQMRADIDAALKKLAEQAKESIK